MIAIPRLALATPATGLEPAPAVLALLAALNSRRWRVQHFSSRARPTANGLIAASSGMPGRHLDSWLMGPGTLQDLFIRGAHCADLSVVEGTLDESPPPVDLRRSDRPGRLGSIAEALELPRVVVLTIPRGEDFHLPGLPPGCQAVLLDDLDDPERFITVRRHVEFLTGCPVLGAIESMPEARAALDSVDRHRYTCGMAALGTSLLRTLDVKALRTLSSSRPLSVCPSGVDRGRQTPALRVAIAQDAAFGGYFPDTLETLESLGAELIEFSPLRDENLPDGADLVLIGCGVPDRHAAELSANLSMISALRTHVCRGRRIYSEGGGTAYLGRSLKIGGRTVPMAGIFPFDAELRTQGPGPSPVTRNFVRGCWMGPRGTEIRGYRSNRWRLRPAPEPDDCPARSGALTEQRDVFFRYHAVGSMIHLHFASLPEVVATFAKLGRLASSVPSIQTGITH